MLFCAIYSLPAHCVDVSEFVIFTMSAKFLKRYETVFLMKNRNWRIKRLQNICESREAFVKKWVKRYLEIENIDDLPEKGLARVTTTKEDKAILRLFQDKPNLSLRCAQMKLRKKGIYVSLNTIRSRLREKNVFSIKKKSLLLEKHVEKRLAWAKENLNWDWDNIIFTDESSFWAWSSLSKAWSTKSNRILQRTIKHPVKVHVWGCLIENMEKRCEAIINNGGDMDGRDIR